MTGGSNKGPTTGLAAKTALYLGLSAINGVSCLRTTLTIPQWNITIIFGVGADVVPVNVYIINNTIMHTYIMTPLLALNYLPYNYLT